MIRSMVGAQTGYLEERITDDGQFWLIARRQVQHRAADQRVSVIGDIAAVIALDHCDTGVLAGSDDAGRHAREQLPDDAAMPQAKSAARLPAAFKTRRNSNRTAEIGAAADAVS